MNRKLFSGLTATLLITALGAPTISQANPPGASPVSSSDQKDAAIAAPPPEAQPSVEASDSKQASPGVGSGLATQAPDSELAKVDRSTPETVKMGEQTSPKQTLSSAEVIAKVHSHKVAGRTAATLYVRNIPVLTFLGSTEPDRGDVKVGTQVPEFSQTAESDLRTKELISSKLAPSSSAPELMQRTQKRDGSEDLAKSNTTPADSQATHNDPTWRATELAAKLNQLHRDGVDAKAITVSWEQQNQSSDWLSDRYAIKAGDTVLTTLDKNTMLPDTTRNLEQDALQATNRLRRLLGDATPLPQVMGKPSPQIRPISLGSLGQATGFASWYGPGFDGNQSASGEIFNQNALTAAHRTLPFGTRVQVTNLDNGQSVVVRINDRGPFHGNRIIDLSMGAARVLGLVQSGVARVRLDFVDAQTASINN